MRSYKSLSHTMLVSMERKILRMDLAEGDLINKLILSVHLSLKKLLTMLSEVIK